MRNWIKTPITINLIYFICFYAQVWNNTKFLSYSMSRRQQTADMEYKRRTAAACRLFCRSFSSSIKTASVKTVGGPMFNKTRPDYLKTAERLNLMPLYTSVAWKKSNKWTEPRKQGLFDRHIPEGHVNASDPIIRIIWFIPAIRCLWSCKLAHMTSAMSLEIMFDSGNGRLSLQITGEQQELNSDAGCEISSRTWDNETANWLYMWEFSLFYSHHLSHTLCLTLYNSGRGSVSHRFTQPLQ